MTLPDEMQRLTEDMREAYEARMQAVTAIRAGAVGEVDDLHAARQEMAAALRRRLADDVDRLRVSVASTRAAMASRVKELRGEMNKAHQIWDELGGFMRRARARVQVTPPAPSVEEKLPSRRQKRLFRKR